MQKSKAILETFINLILKITASKGGHHVVYEVTAFFALSKSQRKPQAGKGQRTRPSRAKTQATDTKQRTSIKNREQFRQSETQTHTK